MCYSAVLQIVYTINKTSSRLFHKVLFHKAAAGQGGNRALANDVKVELMRHSERGAQVFTTRGEKAPLNFCDTRGEVAEFSFSPQSNSSITGAVSSPFFRKVVVIGASAQRKNASRRNSKGTVKFYGPWR